SDEQLKQLLHPSGPAPREQNEPSQVAVRSEPADESESDTRPLSRADGNESGTAAATATASAQRPVKRYPLLVVMRGLGQPSRAVEDEEESITHISVVDFVVSDSSSPAA